MKIKAKSRKRKYIFKNLKKVVKTAVDFIIAAQKIRESKYPKLTNGGIVFGQCNLQGREMIIPIIPKGAAPYDNEPYLFQFNS